MGSGLLEHLLALGALGLLAAFCASLTPAARLQVAALVAVPQVFLHVSRFPLAQVWFLAVAIAAVFGYREGIRRRTPGLVIVLMLAGFSLFAATYSPVVQDAIGATLRLIMFAALAHTAVQAGRDPQRLDSVVKWLAPWLLVEAGLVGWFRFNPDAEHSFLVSGLARVLVGPAATSLYGADRNNVISPLKAGGLFVNGNMASMFLGASALLAYVAYRRAGSRWLLVVAAASLVGVVLTGSKTGIALTLALPVLGALIRSAIDKSTVWRFALLLALAGPTVIVARKVASVWLDGFTGEATTSYDSRAQLWQAARGIFAQNPVSGLGYGGWKAVTNQPLPPHNVIIAEWSDAGLASAVLAVAFMVAIGVAVARAIRKSSGRDRTVAVTVGLAWLWIFLHGMADNTTIYGENHTMFLAALTLGYLASIETTAEDDSPTPDLAARPTATALAP